MKISYSGLVRRKYFRLDCSFIAASVGEISMPVKGPNEALVYRPCDTSYVFLNNIIMLEVITVCKS